ncbi:predicted protein [Streptomyces sp. SPB78]|nr:predicted protein [Streptomyces sp. SPB78]
MGESPLPGEAPAKRSAEKEWSESPIPQMISHGSGRTGRAGH